MDIPALQVRDAVFMRGLGLQQGQRPFAARVDTQPRVRGLQDMLRAARAEGTLGHLFSCPSGS